MQKMLSEYLNITSCSCTDTTKQNITESELPIKSCYILSLNTRAQHAHVAFNLQITPHLQKTTGTQIDSLTGTVPDRSCFQRLEANSPPQKFHVRLSGKPS